MRFCYVEKSSEILKIHIKSAKFHHYKGIRKRIDSIVKL